MKPFQKKIVRYTGITFGITLLLGILLLIAIRIPVPDIPEGLAPDHYTREKIGTDSYRVGPNYLRKNEAGVWEMYIEGSPYERGLVYGVLAKELIHYQEEVFVKQLEELVPNRLYLNFLKVLVAFFNRNLPDHIPAENLEEIYGISKSFSDDFDFIGPKYYRILNYHAAHDIGHALADYRLVGCTSFGLKGNKTEDGQLLIGRNFDFYMGDDFAKEKILLFVKPDQGYKFCSYSWAGFTGVVSGMNEKGLTVSLNAAASALPMGASDPISLLAREILQYASNIPEAAEIARKRQTFVSESILIGSAEDGKTVIMEKSTEKLEIFDPPGDQIICANHYQSEVFQKDARNLEAQKETDSGTRFQRMTELLSRYPTINSEIAATILRDVKGPGEKYLGLGNPASINQLNGHHSIIFKPASRLAWISTFPFQMGNYLCYSLDSVFEKTQTGPIKTKTILSDSLLETETFKNYLYFREIKKKITRWIVFGKPLHLPEAALYKFEASNSSSYETYLSLGNYYQKADSTSKALSCFEIALKLGPASEKEKHRIMEKIIEVKGNSKP